MKMCQYFHLLASVVYSVNISTKEIFSFFFTSDLSSSCWFFSFLMKTRKRLACDMYTTFATHAGCVYDVTDIECWAQNGSTRSHVFVTFKP